MRSLIQRSLTTADRPHRLTLSGIYEFPKYKGEWRWLRAAANGWKASLISQYISSPTANPVIAIDVDGDGISTFTLPGLKWNGFGRGQSADDVRRAVEQYNATYPTPDVTAANRIGALVFLTQRERWSNFKERIAAPEAVTSEDTIWRLSDATRAGDVKAYLDCFSGAFSVWH